jgi:hypothetical protein
MIVQTEQYRACELRVLRDERGFQVDVVDPNHTFLGSSHLHKDARSAMVEAMTLIDQRYNHLRTERHSAMLRASLS